MHISPPPYPYSLSIPHFRIPAAQEEAAWEQASNFQFLILGYLDVYLYLFNDLSFLYGGCFSVA